MHRAVRLADREASRHAARQGLALRFGGHGERSERRCSSRARRVVRLRCPWPRATALRGWFSLATLTSPKLAISLSCSRDGFTCECPKGTVFTCNTYVAKARDFTEQLEGRIH